VSSPRADTNTHRVSQDQLGGLKRLPWPPKTQLRKCRSDLELQSFGVGILRVDPEVRRFELEVRRVDLDLRSIASLRYNVQRAARKITLAYL